MSLLAVILAALAVSAATLAQPQPAELAPAPQPEQAPQPPPVQPQPTPAPVPPPTQPSRQPAAETPTVASTPVPLTEVFKARLEALSPSEPEAYMRLAEEVADQAADLAGRRLAIELFVLAFELDRQAPGGGSTAAGACLALAEMSRSESERRWLTALARTIDPRRAMPEWVEARAAPTTESAAYQVATAIGLVRSGDGMQARQLLDKPEVKTALAGYERVMSNMGAGSISMLTREARRWPCPVCSNERIVKKGQSNPPEYKLCANCEGDPGPEQPLMETMGQLRFELWLLQGAQRSWGAQVAADHGAPLMDPEVEGLAVTFDVDPGAVLWRGGKWTVDPNRVPPEPNPAAKAPEAPAPDATKPEPSPG